MTASESSTIHQTLAAPASFEQQIKHSRFLAQAEPISSVEQAQQRLEALCRPVASHHCWAWRFDSAYRSADAGEPAGTAGRPILAAIDGQGLDRVLVVVSRWFGGVKLGSGGLVRAYGGTAAECLRRAERSAIRDVRRVDLQLAHDDLGLVRHCLGQAGAQVQSEQWLSDAVQLRVGMDAETLPTLCEQLRNATSGRIQIST